MMQSTVFFITPSILPFFVIENLYFCIIDIVRNSNREQPLAPQSE